VCARSRCILGPSSTELARSVPEEELRALRVANPRNFKHAARAGAATSVWCATSSALAGMGGVYCEDVDVGEPVAGGLEGAARRAPVDHGPQSWPQRLWDQERGVDGRSFRVVRAPPIERPWT
jgi:hypothetical protein